MDDSAKATKVATLLLPEVVTANSLLPYVELAQSIVLNKRFPYGYPSTQTVESQFEIIQCQIALELYCRKGAEGEIIHNENGINRTWKDAVVSKGLLDLIPPYCSSVKESEE